MVGIKAEKTTPQMPAVPNLQELDQDVFFDIMNPVLCFVFYFDQQQKSILFFFRV